MTRICAGITRSGVRCTVSVSGAQQFCHLHDPSRADERRRNASRAGRSKPASQEIGQIKADIKRVIEDVRDARLDRGVGAVVGGLYNTLLKALETERRWKELSELEERMVTLEATLEANKKGSNRWGA